MGGHGGKEKGAGAHHVDRRCVCGLTRQSEGVKEIDEDKKKKKTYKDIFHGIPYDCRDNTTAE